MPLEQDHIPAKKIYDNQLKGHNCNKEKKTCKLKDSKSIFYEESALHRNDQMNVLEKCIKLVELPKFWKALSNFYHMQPSHRLLSFEHLDI